MLSLTRRGLITLGGTGAAGAALAACGDYTEPRAEGDDAGLIQAEVEAEMALATAYGQAASTAGDGEQRTALTRFASAAKTRADELAAPGGIDVQQAPPPDGGPDGPEALSAAIVLANAAIAAHRQAAGLLDEVESRGLATSSLAACAAELAAVSGFAGEPEAPSAFVTGGQEDPYEAATDSTEEE